MMKISLRMLLFVTAVIAISIVAFLVWQFEGRKSSTQPVLEISNGTLGDRKMRNLAAHSVAALSTFESSRPELIAFRIQPGKYRYIIATYWVGHSKFADGIEIEFSNGRKIVASFSSDENGWNDKTLFFSSKVFSESLTEGFSETSPEMVSKITLTNDGRQCSDSVTVTNGSPDDTIWKDAIIGNVNDDFQLWGFRESQISKDPDAG